MKKLESTLFQDESTKLITNYKKPLSSRFKEMFIPKKKLAYSCGLCNTMGHSLSELERESTHIYKWESFHLDSNIDISIAVVLRRFFKDKHIISIFEKLSPLPREHSHLYENPFLSFFKKLIQLMQIWRYKITNSKHMPRTWALPI